MKCPTHVCILNRSNWRQFRPYVIKPRRDAIHVRQTAQRNHCKMYCRIERPRRTDGHCDCVRGEDESKLRQCLKQQQLFTYCFEVPFLTAFSKFFTLSPELILLLELFTLFSSSMELLGRASFILKCTKHKHFLTLTVQHSYN